MNCVNCYQEIPDGSRFCPHCGAQQPETPGAGYDNTQADANAAGYSAQPEDSAQQNTQYQDAYTSDYQSSQYQTPPVYQSYQSSYEPGTPVNWVPYLVLSIITTLCCCLPFGIVGIVYAAKINSAANVRDWEGAQKAARTAKIWIIVSAVVGLISEIFWIVITVNMAGSGYYYY